jgi:hypothetical protein
MPGTLMGSPDSTIVIPAFPTISQSHHEDLLSRLWIILICLLWWRSVLSNSADLTISMAGAACSISGLAFSRSVHFSRGFSKGIRWLILSRAIQAFRNDLMSLPCTCRESGGLPLHLRGYTGNKKMNICCAGGKSIPYPR